MQTKGQILAAGFLHSPVALSIVLGTPNTVATDCTSACFFTLTANNSFTLSNPTNAQDGQIVVWRIRQDGVGGRVITLDTNFGYGTDITAVTLSTSPNVYDYLAVRYESTTTEFHVVSFVRGYA